MATKKQRGEITVYCLADDSVTYCSKQAAEALTLMRNMDETDQRRFLKLIRASKAGVLPFPLASAPNMTPEQIRSAADALP